MRIGWTAGGIAAVILALSIASCNQGQPDSISSIKLDPPQPLPGAVGSELTTNTESQVGMDLAISHERLRQLAEASVPKELDSGGNINQELTNWIVDDWYRYHFTRGPIALGFRDNVLDYSVPIGGTLTGGGKVNLGLFKFKVQETADIDATVRGSITLNAGTDYSVTAVPSVSLECRKAKIVINHFPDISVCGKVTEAFNDKVPAIAQKAISAALVDLRLREKVDALWQQLSSARQITDQPSTWIVIEPAEVRLRPLNLSPDPIMLGFGVRAHTSVKVQNSEPKVVKKPLPGLVIDPAISNAFNLRVPIHASLETLMQTLRTELVGKTYDLSKDTSLTIKDLVVGTSGERIVFGVDIDAINRLLKKSASGRIWLIGDLTYDKSISELKVEKIDFEQKTHDLLVNVAAWLLHDTIKNELQSKAHYNAKVEIDKAKETANELIAAKSKPDGPFTVEMKVDKLDLESLNVSSGELFAFFTAEGHATAVAK